MAHLSFKADINSDIPRETTAIFFLAHLYLKQGISLECVMVNFMCMDLSTYSTCTRQNTPFCIISRIYTNLEEEYIWIKATLKGRFHKSRLALSVEALTTNLKVLSSNPTVGRDFSFWIFRCPRSPRRSTEAIQIKSSMTFIRGM